MVVIFLFGRDIEAHNLDGLVGAVNAGGCGDLDTDRWFVRHGVSWPEIAVLFVCA